MQETEDTKEEIRGDGNDKFYIRCYVWFLHMCMFKSGWWLMWIKIKERFNKILDIAVLRQENKILKQQLEEEKKKNQPLINLKNKYLAELRAKNLELGRLKKKAGNDEIK